MADLKFKRLARQSLLSALMISGFCFISVTLSEESNYLNEINADDNNKKNIREPSVFVAMLIRNKAHTLPWFLYYFEKLDYPKSRMRLWIRSDHNDDNSADIVREWLIHAGHQYSSVDFVDDPSERGYESDKRPFVWSQEHMENVIDLRQMALDAARRLWSDYLLMIDVDNFLLNPSVLQELIKEERIVIAPMFNTSVSETYSNFWCGMDNDGYYVRTPDYEPIVRRQIRGVFKVPMVHSTVLIQLKNPASKHLSYKHPPSDYSAAVDDLIIFAHVAKHHEIPMHIVNRHFYGYMLVPMETYNTLEDERQQFIHLKLEYIVCDNPLQKLPYIEIPHIPLTKLGFDEVFLINLERRDDRRQRMIASFLELGINFTVISAVDGKKLNESYLVSLGISMLHGYADPYHGRVMTMGEIGCFLSHYFIWQSILANHYRKVIVFEDDIRFQPYFQNKLNILMKEAQSTIPDWDLIYLGRKRLQIADEFLVAGTESLVWPHYSYWTLSYLLSYRGAAKLIQQNPLKKMLPVDEYLPIMFDRHPETAWKEKFFPRDLISLSANPLLVEPTHYTGEEGYITDTEDSPIIGGSVSKQKEDSMKNLAFPEKTEL